MITKLYTVYRSELLNYCCMICGNSSDAEDLLQECFLKALSNLDLLEELDEKQQRAWFYKVARNLFYDLCRRRAVEKKYETQAKEETDGGFSEVETAMDTNTILSKDLKFASDKIVIAESLAPKLIAQFDEEAEIVSVPDGSVRIDGNLDLKPETIRKYGAKLCVCGDVSIGEAEALSALEFLYADGEIRVAKNLKDAFEKLDSIYDELKIIDPDVGRLNNRPALKVGAATLKKFPKGVQIEDCAKVTLAKDLNPDDIMEKIRISDCALVSCSKEQEEAVHMIANGVAKILVAEDDEDDSDDFFGTVKGFLGKLKDTQMINAAEYTM